MSQLVYSSQKGNPITDSLKVAATLGKRHSNVLDSLKRLVVTSDFRREHYRASTYVDQKGECRPLVEMTAEGEAQLRHSFTQRRADLTTHQTYFLLAQGLERLKIGQATDVAKQLAVLQAGCPVPLVLLLALPNSSNEEAAPTLCAPERGRGLVCVRSRIAGIHSGRICNPL